MAQQSFNVKKEIIRKDENKKWEKLKKWMKMLDRMFDEGKIINNIDNGAMVKKIIKKMDKLELNEDIFGEFK